MDAMEKATSTIIKSYLATLSPKERVMHVHYKNSILSVLIVK